jgi:hypothetical protein
MTCCAIPNDVDSGTVLSAMLYLLATTTLHGLCPGRAVAIAAHFHWLAGRSDLDPVVRRTCERLHQGWRRSVALPTNATETDDEPMTAGVDGPARWR